MRKLKFLKKICIRPKTQPTNINFHVTYAVNSVITQILFAKKFDKYGPIFPKLAKSVHDLIAVFADQRFMLVGLPFRLSFRVLPWGSEVEEGRAFLKKFASDIIEDHVRTFDPNNLRDYVDSYLYERKNLEEKGELEQSSFTMERLLAISMNMTMEGTDSVGETICSLLTEAAKHPEEQKKKAFIQELFRIAQAFNNTTHYCNFEETTIQGFRIPKRSIIVGNLWSINNDPELFPNPSKFDPNRYLGENLKVMDPIPSAWVKETA
ncbi:cytochrome P450 2U1 [Caerostris extrusa]|uniref:Cytochrome P450 2U1 n=1 Tax=Caerostris extrusa TaxID=172846 RepID=A0AAV4X9L4_CAEEX|nr:cytochrome P450 2U1 [Caerostris extrusa]